MVIIKGHTVVYTGLSLGNQTRFQYVVNTRGNEHFFVFISIFTVTCQLRGTNDLIKLVSIF